MGGVQVGVQPGGALAQQAGVTVTGVQQVVQEFAADPLFGLGGGAAGEQQQRGDHRGAFEGALVDRVEAGVAAQHQRAEEFPPAATAAIQSSWCRTACPSARDSSSARAGAPAGSANSTVPSRTSETAAATSCTPPPRSTSSASRSCTSEARSMTALRSWMISLARSRPARAERVSVSRLAVSMAAAASAAKEPSSAICSRSKTRARRSAANSTPMTCGPSISGTPRMATSPSSRTPASMLEVCWKRSSWK
ncbi:hypothetical protein SGLAM104S_09387 [Streptomyces glaucescens]